MSKSFRHVRWVPLLVISVIALGGGAAIGWALGTGRDAYGDKGVLTGRSVE